MHSVSLAKTLLSISRPRFWHYLIGPRLIGYTASLSHLGDFGQQRWFWVFLVYFSFPANLLVYGVNDISDGDTDQHNPKKKGYESMLQVSTSCLSGWIIGLNLPFGILAWALGPWAWAAWAWFVVFSLIYSLPPIRAKAVPFFDGITNILYVLPGIMAYLVLHSDLSRPLVIAAWAWVMAMHAYSAIPDIEADTKAWFQTTATILGRMGTLTYCGILYIIAALLSYPSLGTLSIGAGATYIVMLILASRGKAWVVYKSFPWINLIVGFGLRVMIVKSLPR